ncbi:hypothetical protein KP509_30G061300 [Ceratopteris richardii]|uniref:Homeobox domain-containing protein n=1 Tax=Ceratopteris richardii TaxID=49495 RepID=A0A8T2R560_CERRI|nr:hypothetical protein KP509_30G061300 [Ceratopteris richardii]
MAWSPVKEEHLPQLVSTESTIEKTLKAKDPCKRPKRRAKKRTGKGSTIDDSIDKRRGLTVEQINFLEMSFKEDNKLEPERKACIAKQLGVRPRQVAIWFQNRRVRWKNKQVEQDYETLKARYQDVVKEKDSIMMQYESTMEGNRKLQAEVARLTNLLQSTEGISAHTDMDQVLSNCNSENLNCISENISPAKSADYPSEIIVSGDPTEGDISRFIFQEPISSMPYDLLPDGDYFILSPENSTGNFPSLVQQLVSNGHCVEDAYNIYLGYEYLCC